MRAAPFGPEALVVVLFPLLGLGFVSFGFSRGVRASYLLKHGMLTSARFVSKTPTNLQVGRQTVYSFTFAFTTDHGQACTASSKTLSALFENGGEELALYDPVQPQRVVILGALTYAP
jgi:hypothetical protein